MQLRYIVILHSYLRIFTVYVKPMIEWHPFFPTFQTINVGQSRVSQVVAEQSISLIGGVAAQRNYGNRSRSYHSFSFSHWHPSFPA